MRSAARRPEAIQEPNQQLVALGCAPPMASRLRLELDGFICLGLSAGGLLPAGPLPAAAGQLFGVALQFDAAGCARALVALTTMMHPLLIGLHGLAVSREVYEP